MLRCGGWLRASQDPWKRWRQDWDPLPPGKWLGLFAPFLLCAIGTGAAPGPVPPLVSKEATRIAVWPPRLRHTAGLHRFPRLAYSDSHADCSSLLQWRYLRFSNSSGPSPSGSINVPGRPSAYPYRLLLPACPMGSVCMYHQSAQPRPACITACLRRQPSTVSCERCTAV